MNTWDEFGVAARMHGGNYIATGTRLEDKVYFAETGTDPEDARKRLDRWLAAPLKTWNQTTEDYMASESYLDYCEKMENE